MEVGTRAMQGKEEGIPIMPMDAPLRAVTMAQPSSSDAVLFHQPPSTLHRQLVYTAMHHSQVMTDEQLETLRRQISVYSTICQQLVEMHKAMVAQQQSSIPGSQFGQSISFDPAFYSAGHKMASRQRWTPSQTQLQVLESLFEQERGTLSKQMIKDITLELSQHGPISETNVYNWFQNRRARTKRKQQLEGSNNGESELDTDVESPEVKKAKTERDLWSDGLGADLVDMSFQGSHSADHHKSQQGLLQPSQMHIHMNSSAASFERAVDTHGHCFSEDGHLVDCKPWDIPKSVLDIKADLVRPSESQELQERRVLVNGTRKS